ncbi:MAG: hypothetical protein C0402_05390 [Thermodesulfovibrio sp.]|nr:hypothetical protein [Thermodesulfovibrio sp.]
MYFLPGKVEIMAKTMPSVVKHHEWLMAVKKEDYRRRPYWRIDGRFDQIALEEIVFCPPEMIRSKLRNNTAKIIDWFTNEDAGTV